MERGAVGEAAGRGRAHDPDARWLAPVMHVAFFLLLAASLVRFLIRHPGEPRTPWIIGLSAVLAALYLLGPALGPALGSRPTPRQLAWLGAVVGVWLVLVVLAPSFAWCAVPLFYTGLRTLPPRAALGLVAVLTVFVVGAQLSLAGGFDPNLVLAPPAVAAIAVAVFLHMERQATRQRTLIDDLIHTRRELAATERREGTLAERQRLAMEIHDTLAQGLSSQQMLLQAADRVWDADSDAARHHVRTAESIAEHNLAEARRFVHDLAPAELAESGGLTEALRTLAARETAKAAPGAGAGADTDADGEGDAGESDVLTVRFHLEGTPVPLPDRVASALLRIAQGALANVREHAAATTAALTLTHLDDGRVVLDIADNGRGFDPSRTSRTNGTSRPSEGADGVRGHGLPAMRARARALGGTLSIESAPGEGTVVTATVPLPQAHPTEGSPP
ncbi:sensor histidine kinase [Streptomyces apocyni]|uniref:sensor histidine kinase n=1 Tax=Streptomyces apocyni TaxID=2654677 RepID=UPI001E3E8493|nr:sensor histidine kinase [Streptomyces apocyni]